MAPELTHSASGGGGESLSLGTKLQKASHLCTPLHHAAPPPNPLPGGVAKQWSASELEVTHRWHRPREPVPPRARPHGRGPGGSGPQAGPTPTRTEGGGAEEIRSVNNDLCTNYKKAGLL